ncbi:L-asparaginase 1 [Marinobacterium nitratireducens]|uniref:asparaginase n=1 Tax=Marinobacterium nitratireducens TaxID=518897 RepID=A0A918DXA5_9GAMM|nr:asparaginase [Marinobacterium nitratireducens]GGO86635.1 L-asparaginase 1 [Marinobacterium nitratireducens]
MKSNVLIIHTGGTIGMHPSDQGYVPVPGFEALLRERLIGQAQQNLPRFDLLEFEHLIDSSNIQPSDWTRIGHTLIDHYGQYDGFVILHGTDTMAYTASMLSFMLQGLDKPVILTGSQIPLIEPRNDALDNLITALILAGNYRIPEVGLYFNGRLLRGNRACKLRASGFDAFDSPNCPWLGQVGIHIELQDHLLLERDSPRFKVPEFNPEAVSLLHLYPGMPGSIAAGLLQNPALKGLLIRSFGVGNPPDRNRELMDALADAERRGIVVVNLTQCLQGRVSQGAYATGATLNRLGVVAGGDLTVEAAFTKLHFLIAIGLTAEQIRSQMQAPICGEQSA